MTRKLRGFPTRRSSIILPQKLYDKLVLIQHQEVISSISETIAYLIRKEKLLKTEQQIVQMKSTVLTNQETEELLSEFLSQPRKEQEE